MGKTSLDIAGLWVSHRKVLWVNWVAQIWRAWRSPSQRPPIWRHAPPVAAGLALFPTQKWTETRNNWVYSQANLLPWDFQPPSPRKHVQKKTFHEASSTPRARSVKLLTHLRALAWDLLSRAFPPATARSSPRSTVLSHRFLSENRRCYRCAEPPLTGHRHFVLEWA